MKKIKILSVLAALLFANNMYAQLASDAVAITDEKLKELLAIKKTDSAKVNARTVQSFTKLASDSASAIPGAGVGLAKEFAVKKKRIKPQQTGLVSEQLLPIKN